MEPWKASVGLIFFLTGPESLQRGFGAGLYKVWGLVAAG